MATKLISLTLLTYFVFKAGIFLKEIPFIMSILFVFGFMNIGLIGILWWRVGESIFDKNQNTNNIKEL